MDPHLGMKFLVQTSMLHTHRLTMNKLKDSICCFYMRARMYNIKHLKGKEENEEDIYENGWRSVYSCYVGSRRYEHHCKR